MMNRRGALVVLLALAVLVVGGVWYWGTLFSGPAAVVTVSPKWVNQAQFAGMFVAIEKGFYARQGLTVHIKEFDENTSVKDDVLDRVAQFGLMSANELLTSVAAGAPLKGIAAFYQTSPFVVVSLGQLDITSPTDLRGKKLAIKGGRGAEGESIYRILLTSAGLDPDAVAYEYLPFGTSEFEDLLAEKADAIGLYRTDQLYSFIKENVSHNVLYPERYGSAVYNDVLVARDDYLMANSDVARRFIEATREGWEYVFAHEDEALAITARYITHASYADPAHERFILEASRPLIQTATAGIGSMNLNRWTAYVQTLITMGVLPKSYQISDAVTTEYLP